MESRSHSRITLDSKNRLTILRNSKQPPEEAKFAGQHLRQSLFLIKLQTSGLLKKRLMQVFSCEFCEVFNK